MISAWLLPRAPRRAAGRGRVKAPPGRRASGGEVALTAAAQSLPPSFAQKRVHLGIPEQRLQVVVGAVRLGRIVERCDEALERGIDLEAAADFPHRLGARVVHGGGVAFGALQGIEPLSVGAGEPEMDPR